MGLWKLLDRAFKDVKSQREIKIPRDFQVLSNQGTLQINKLKSAALSDKKKATQLIGDNLKQNPSLMTWVLCPLLVYHLERS